MRKTKTKAIDISMVLVLLSIDFSEGFEENSPNKAIGTSDENIKFSKKFRIINQKQLQNGHDTIISEALCPFA